MDADVNTHASVYLSTPSLLCLCMLMQRTCATGKLLHIKSVSHGNEAQARPELSWAEQELQSNRIDGNFFSFAKVLRRMCHMDRSRNSSQTRPGLSRPCCCCCCPQVSYLSIARTTTGEFSVFCAFLKWANLCDTLRQLIKLNKHEAEPRTDREREVYIYRKRWNGNRDSAETEQSRRKIPFPFLAETRDERDCQTAAGAECKTCHLFLKSAQRVLRAQLSLAFAANSKEKHKIHA